MSGPPDISASSVSTAGYEDGLGRRSVRFNREVGGMLECLHLRPQFVVFEPALRARAEALGRLEDERFALVRHFENDAAGLSVISDLVAGQRLIDVLETRSDEAAVSGIDAAFGFLLQAMPAIAELHSHSITHGALAPGRIIVTPNSQVVLLDNIYGAALERLSPARQTLWTSFGVMAAPVDGSVPFDRRTDVGQVALCALLLALGRPLDGTASIASLVPLVREIAELAEIRAGASFAEGVSRFFIDALPAVGKRRPIEADEATATIRRLLTHISEDESLSALAELVSYRPPVRLPAESQIAQTAIKQPPTSPLAEVVLPRTIKIKSPEPVAAPVIEAVTPAPEPAIVPPIPPVAVPAGSFTQYTPPAPPLEAEQQALSPEPLWTTPPAPAAGPPPPAAPVSTLPPPPSIAAVWTPPPAAAVLTPPSADPVQTPPPTAAPAVWTPPPPATRPWTPPAAALPPVQPPRIPAALAQSPAAASITVAPQAPAIKIRPDGPAAHARIRIKESEAAPPTEAATRGLSFLEQAGSQRDPFPWKIAAAAVLVLLVGGAAGRDYLLGTAEPAPVEKQAAAAPAPVAASLTTGGLVIDSQPSGAKVTLDGKEVGTTPLTLDAIKPGRHQVTITSGSALVQRSIRIEAGKQSTINVPVFSGWVAVFAPIRLEVSEGRRSLGSTEDGRILLPPGKHVLTLSSTEFGYTRNETVEISPGEERVLNLQPTGTVNLNASPWAEVWVDGKRAGETPLANMEVLLGTREFVFKHPQFGERKLTATITTTNSPLSVDFGRPPSRP